MRLLTLALKPRGNITRNPKQGYQWPHKKDFCPPKCLTEQVTVRIWRQRHRIFMSSQEFFMSTEMGRMVPNATVHT